MSKLDNLFSGGAAFLGTDTGAAQFAEGLITSVSATIGIRFTIPTYDDSTYVWGPAPYPIWTSTDASPNTGPNVGNRCLILFPTGIAIDPWVIGWWPS